MIRFHHCTQAHSWLVIRKSFLNPSSKSTHTHTYTAINLLHAFQRSHQFCLNNLNDFRHLSASWDCNYWWPLHPPAAVCLIRPLLILRGLWGEMIARVISHSCVTFLLRRMPRWSHPWIRFDAVITLCAIVLQTRNSLSVLWRW